MSVASELERQIGVPAGHFVSIDSHEKRVALRAWLVAQGVSPKKANRMRDEHIRASYQNALYLRKVRDDNPIRPGEQAVSVDMGNWDDAETAEIMASLDQPAQGQGNGSTSANARNNANADIFAEPPAAQAPAPRLNPSEQDIARAADVVLSARITQAKRELEASLDTRIKNAKLELSDDAKRLLRQISVDAAREAFETWLPPRRIEIVNPTSGVSQDIGLQHFRFETLLRACQIRMPNGFRPNIWLTGPAGSGKTTGGENVAKALSFAFGADSSLDADFKVLGYRNASGDYVETEFFRRFTQGGIWLADEVDNWFPSALLSINAPLANGWCNFPHGMFKRHPDFICIACANTWGLGATNEYVGRTKLDAASIDRFQPKIDWPIDEVLEHAIASSIGGSEWCRIVQDYRAKAKKQGLHVLITPRATFAGIALLQGGFSEFEAMNMTFAAGLAPAQRQALGIAAVVEPQQRAL